MRTEPPKDSGNCEAITIGMPSACSACAMLAPTPVTEPTLPLLQLASVTTAGRVSRPAVPLREVRSAVARRSPLTRSGGPSGCAGSCSNKPKRVS